MVNTVRRSLSLSKGVDEQVVLRAVKDGRSVSATAERLIEAALAMPQVARNDDGLAAMHDCSST
jgi:plasmid stability protein